MPREIHKEQKEIERQILHMDGDAFFVGVEIAKNPKLRGLPVVTGEERGIVSALSYEAKALGIKRGMPIFKLKKEFPQVIVLPGDYASYEEYSEKMFEVVRRYADCVEEYSIDECFADFSGWERPLGMSFIEIAKRIKKEIKEELDLSVSLGLAPTKVLAKVASKWQKPNGLIRIFKSNINDYLLKTKIEDIWGIGRRTSLFLKDKKIITAKDFVDKDIAWVRENLSKPYEIIWHELRGKSIMLVDPEPKMEYSSIQKTLTFHPITNNRYFLLSQLSKHTEDACRKARHFGLVPRRISFFLKTQDFVFYPFDFPLPIPTNSPEVILSFIKKYFDRVWKKGVLYRTAGVTLLGLVPESSKQLGLFDTSGLQDKFESIHKQIDLLEEKLEKRVVFLGSTIKHTRGFN